MPIEARRTSVSVQRNGALSVRSVFAAGLQPGPSMPSITQAGFASDLAEQVARHNVLACGRRCARARRRHGIPTRRARDHAAVDATTPPAWPSAARASMRSLL
jgi:hypothetical protein